MIKTSTIERRKRMLRATAACLFLAAAGCATPMPQSGFLEHYDEFEKVRDDAVIWQFLAPSGIDREENEVALWRDASGAHRMAEYDRVIIDPVVVPTTAETEDVTVDPERVQEIRQFMYDSLVSALSDRYAVVDEPAAGVVRFRTALTRIWPMHVFPQKQSVTARVSNTFAGGATIECEAVDALSGERIIGLIGSARGSRWEALDEEDVYEQAKLAAKGLAAFTRAVMDEAHDGDLPGRIEQP